MAWHSYNLDQRAHDLVLKYRDHKVLNQSHKMRSAVAYGLERFWGEQLRLDKAEERNYWRDTWKTLVEIMRIAGVQVPNDAVSATNTQQIQEMTNKLWSFDQEQRKVTLAVLTQLCDSLEHRFSNSLMSKNTYRQN